MSSKKDLTDLLEKELISFTKDNKKEDNVFKLLNKLKSEFPLITLASIISILTEFDTLFIHLKESVPTATICDKIKFKQAIITIRDKESTVSLKHRKFKVLSSKLKKIKSNVNDDLTPTGRKKITPQQKRKKKEIAERNETFWQLLQKLHIFLRYCELFLK